MMAWGGPPLRCSTGTSEDVRHGSPPHAGAGVIESATPLACRGPHLRLGSVPPGSCAPCAWTGQRPAEALHGSHGLAAAGFASALAAVLGHRWRRGVAEPPTTLHAWAPRTFLRVTGHALPVSSGAFPAPWLGHVMRRGTVAD